jgi:hypothetical protein
MSEINSFIEMIKALDGVGGYLPVILAAVMIWALKNRERPADPPFTITKQDWDHRNEMINNMNTRLARIEGQLAANSRD